MLLAEALRAPDGRELAPAGAALKARHLRALELWDVVSVEVTAGTETAASTSAGTRTAVQDRLRLSDPAHPLVAALARIASERDAGGTP